VRLNPYLNFNGQCEVAFKFYEKCLGGKIVMMMTHACMPVESQVPKEWRDKILHATLNVGDQVLQGADLPPEHYKKPQGISVMLALADTAEAEHISRLDGKRYDDHAAPGNILGRAIGYAD
jgi:PhnB protein